MKSIRIALLLALLCPFLSATTTVTGNIKSLGTTTTTGFIRFWLRGCNGNQPRVSGTAIFPSNVNGQFYFDVPANSSGVVSGSLYSTRAANGIDAGEIDCGGSRLAVWYGMQVFRNSVGGPETPVHAKNTAILDVTNVTPISTQSVVAAPTGDTTYLRLDGGNSPMTGPLSLNSLTANSVYSNLFSGPVSSSNIAVNQPGVFTDGQFHQYITSLLGGISFDMYRSVQGFPGYTTEAGTFGVAVPSNTTVKEADALVGMVTSTCNSASRTTCNAVAISGHAQARANGAGVWGQNTTVSNDIGTTAVNLVGNEIDVGINGNQSGGYVHGLDIFLSSAAGSTMPSNVGGTAIEIGATPPNAPPSKWSQGIYILGTSVQSSGNALYSDPTCVTGPCDSLKITLTGVDPGNNPKFGSWYVDSAGNIVLTATALKPPAYTYATLPATTNGVVVYCSDCKNIPDNGATAGAACQSGGNGTVARRDNNRWDCN